jgi:hypothetical protein
VARIQQPVDEAETPDGDRANAMSDRKNQLITICMLIGAIAMIGLALTGILQMRRRDRFGPLGGPRPLHVAWRVILLPTSQAQRLRIPSPYRPSLERLR